MKQEDFGPSIDEITLTPWKPTDPISIYYKEELKVSPPKAVLEAKQVVTFQAININVLVFFPSGIFVGVDETEIPTDPGDPFFFKLNVDQPVSLRAIDKNLDLEYFVTAKFFDGHTEGVQRPPVIIIKKVDL